MLFCLHFELASFGFVLQSTLRKSDFVRRNKMLHYYYWAVVSVVCSFILLASCDKFPFQDPKLPWDQRVNDLVGRLTVDEMVNQSLSTYSGPPSGIERLNVPPYFFRSECLHGYVGRNATAFPQSINLAATFR